MNGPPQKRKRACHSAPSETTNQPRTLSQNDKIASSRAVEFRELLGGDVVLLPIKRGSKRPHSRGWQHFTPERMAEPEYLAELNHGGNIGVLLGHGLITIDWDQDDVR